MQKTGISLPLARRTDLLRLARIAAQRHLGDPDSALPDRWPPERTPYGGLFVTLWSKEALRGCVGNFAATADLWQAVQEVAQAALSDPRFLDRPVTAAELATICFEISLLSELKPSHDPAGELVVGTHGLVVHQAERSGCFLPKVATQRGWTPEQFLSQCCIMKAGLPADAWKDPETEVFLFTADVFSELRAQP